LRNRSVISLLLTGLLAIAVFGFGGTGLLETLTGSTTPAPGSSAAPVPGSPAGAVATNPSALPSVNESALPAEARQTLASIRNGGPYRYNQDDQTFGNNERVLPRQSSGYYREYTVITPGSSDRGARRIIAGSAGEKYYTQDHYASFKFITEGR
jgi:ribonuclease T1